ncbi:RDD family protein [Streptacidiphilus sp. EB129]|uniref:RDD family protein n=1 Tax=Streptacidiphilus sp. EB129 TaxID=3156262 RepID=UPI003516E870
MTTPEPPGEPTPPSFEKPTGGGSPYDTPPPYGGSPYGAPPSDPNPYGGGRYGGGQYGGGQSYGPAGGPAGGVQDVMPPLGGVGTRLVARIIDWVLLAIIAVPLSLVAAFANSRDRTGFTFAVEILLVLLNFLYEGLMLTMAGGQTVGKKVMRIRVAVLANGAMPVGSVGWIRAAVWTLPGIVCCLWQIVDALWCTWDRPYQQCLHDKAAKTVVVKVL